MSNIYEQAGVSITEGDHFVKNIKNVVAESHTPSVLSGLGGFGALFQLDLQDYKEPILVSGTDGVGSKLQLAQKYGREETIGIDLVAMCANDIVCHGAKPLFFLDYFATGKLEADQHTKIIKGIVNGCKIAGCALVGGETAEMPTTYKPEDFDLAGFIVGIVDKNRMLPRTDIREGDIVIGLFSSGIHSNGFSMVNRNLDSEEIIDLVLAPTKIYVKECLDVVDKVKAFAHITGGGLIENVPRVIPDGLCANISFKWDIPEVFEWIMDGSGLRDDLTGPVDFDEMLRVFNCGIGMVAIVSQHDLYGVLNKLHDNHSDATVLGTISKSINGEKIRVG